MKKILIAFCILLMTLSIVNAEPFETGDLMFQASGTVGYRSNDDVYFGGGILGSYLLTDYFSIQFVAVGGPQWVELSSGVILFPLGILSVIHGDKNDSGSDVLLGMLLLLSILENPSFHIPIGDVVDFSPSVHLLRFHYSKSLNFQIKGGIGLALNIIPKKRLVTSLYGEGDITYSKNPSFGIRTGIRVGIKFPTN